jgi:hypothetical protein
MIAATTNLTVRPLAVNEVARCVPFGHAFYEELRLPDAFSPSDFIEAWTTMLCVQDAVILGLWDGDTLVGGLGAVVSPNINSGVRLGADYFWYVQPAYRAGSGALRLFRAFMAWAREHGAKRCRMILSETDPRVEQLTSLYKRLGGVRCESAWEFPL